MVNYRQKIGGVAKDPRDKTGIAIPLRLACIALVAYVFFIAILLSAANYHLFGLVGFSRDDTGVIPENTPWREFAHPKPGYDGQYYFRLALEPFTDRKEAFGIGLDKPVLRQQRILLPLLTWLIARGDPRTTAFAMLGINISSLIGIAIISSLLLAKFGVSKWYGLPFAFYAGFAISVDRYLTEPLTIFMILSSLLMLAGRRHCLAAMFLSLAVLSRETASILVAAGFLTWVWEKIFGDSNSHGLSPHFSFWLYPAITFILWHLWLFKNWSLWLVDSADSNKIGLPFAGLVQSVYDNTANLHSVTAYYLLMTATVILFQAYLIKYIKNFPTLLLISWSLYALLAICVGTAVWGNSASFLRVFAELNILGLIGLLATKKIPQRPLILGWFAGWVLSATAEWYHLYMIR